MAPGKSAYNRVRSHLFTISSMVQRAKSILKRRLSLDAAQGIGTRHVSWFLPRCALIWFWCQFSWNFNVTSVTSTSWFSENPNYGMCQSEIVGRLTSLGASAPGFSSAKREKLRSGSINSVWGKQVVWEQCRVWERQGLLAPAERTANKLLKVTIQK